MDVENKAGGDLFLFHNFLQKSRISKQASQPALLSGFSFLMNDLPSEASVAYQILRGLSRKGSSIAF